MQRFFLYDALGLIRPWAHVARFSLLLTSVFYWEEISYD